MLFIVILKMDEEMLKKLEEQDLLINPENLERYVGRFKNYEENAAKNLADERFWNGKRVFITGVSGFAGSHLAEKLVELGSNVCGFVRRHSVPEYKNINSIVNKIKLVEGNLMDFSSILNYLDEFEPEIIFHLGAQSFVPTSFRVPIETYETNVTGTANLLEAMRKSNTNIESVLVACSSEEYGLVYPNELPIAETNPLRPQSPYAASKVAAEIIAKVHHGTYGTPTVITRAFNHTGPRRGLQFVTSVVCRQIARCNIKGTKEIFIGNPSPIRDFNDVRDVVQGYLLAVEKGRKGEPYNIGHGVGITIENFVKLAASISNIAVDIRIDPSRFRPAEVEALICDYSKAKNEIGYYPQIPLTKAIKDNVEYFKNNPHLLDIERH